MNKFNILLILVFLSFTLKAQSLENEGEVLLKSPTFTHAATDVLGNYVIVFQTNKQLEFSFFDVLHKKTRDLVITTPAHIKKDAIIAVQLQGDSCTAYFMNEHSKIIAEINISRANGFSSKRIIGQLAFTEKFLKCVYLNNAFYIITATYGKNQIDVHQICETGLRHFTYQFDMPDLYRRLSTGNNILNEDPSALVGIDLVHYDIENNVKSARSTKKLYVIENSLYLVFDDADFTQIVQIDIEKNKSSYKKFQFSLEKANANSKKQGNSFLYHETLFRVTFSSEQLAFTIIDINDHVSHAIFYATPHNAINFKNGPIIQENADDKQRVIDDSKTFFEKMSKLNISIAANKKDSMYIVEIGCYDENAGAYQNNNNNVTKPAFSVGVGVGMGMGMGSMGMGPVHNYGQTEVQNLYGWNYPGYYTGYSGYYPYNNATTNISTIYLHTMLSDSTFEQKSGIIPISLRERISNFEEATFKSDRSELVQVVDFTDKIIVGYLVPNKNTFRQYLFYK